MVLAEKYTKNRLGSHWIRKFYEARYFRLFPAYFICLVLSILYFFTKTDFDLSEYSEIPTGYINKVFELPTTPRNILLWIWFMFSNVFMFFQDFVLLIYVAGKQSFFSLREIGGDFYLPSAMLMPQAWSIGIEILFYLVAPLILGWKTRYLLLIGGSLLLAKIVIICLQPHDVLNMRFWYETFPTLVQEKQSLKNIGANLGWRSDIVYRFFPFELPYFLLGGLAFRYREKLNVFSEKDFKGGKFFQILLVYFLVFIITMVLPGKGYDYSIPLILFTGILIPSFFFVTSQVKFDNFIGELSYPVYIFHILCLIYSANTWKKFDSVAIYLNIDHNQLITVMTIFLTLGISILYALIERYFINPLRQKISAPNWHSPKSVDK
jgi:peptidoglycan/LPS O-acetylase OafA/YrhL